ncbi:MAG: hypothetical protein AAFV53_07605 [Myxococcota bacterium]
MVYQSTLTTPLSEPTLVVATRFHQRFSRDRVDVSRIRSWAEDALRLGGYAVIATEVGLEGILSDGLSDLAERLEVLPVHPWRSFSAASNAIVSRAVELQAETLLLQSVEVSLSAAGLAEMRGALNTQAIVVGARMSDRHGPEKGRMTLRGLNCPWNTLALWRLDYLGRFGFPMTADSLLPEFDGGMEEAGAISLLQHLDPSLEAILMPAPGVVWHTQWADPTRRRYHEQKLASKDARAAQLLRALHLPPGEVSVR